MNQNLSFLPNLLTVEVFNKAEDAAVNADLIVTDVWASMGQEEEQKLREKAFADFK